MAIKSLACSALLVLCTQPVLAQIAASFNVSHAGLQPSAEATVNVGDTVKFIHGGGGPHPMTSGHNQTPSPIFFPTVSVTIGAPEATFALDEPGVYYFHCGTNPMNSSNWGTLTVVDPNTPTRVGEASVPSWSLQSNLVQGVVTLLGEPLPKEVALFNMAGREVHRWNPSLTKGVLSVAGLTPGVYVLRDDNFTAWPLWIQ